LIFTRIYLTKLKFDSIVVVLEEREDGK